HGTVRISCAAELGPSGTFVDDEQFTAQAEPRRDNSMPKPRGHPFEKGRPSPNPNGRPRGARNRTTLAAEALLDGEAEAITRKAIELAKAGDLTAIRLCVDHICPIRRGRRLGSTLPRLDT